MQLNMSDPKDKPKPFTVSTFLWTIVLSGISVAANSKLLSTMPVNPRSFKVTRTGMEQ